MQTKYERYEQLAENSLKSIIESQKNWTDFLNTAAVMYKYSFDEQLLIHAQRPDTKACASFEFWTRENNMNRHIRRGTDGIALLNRNTHKLYYVYAVEDTENRQNGRSKNPEDYIWKMTEKHETAVADMLEKQFGISEKKLTDGLVKLAELSAEKFIPEYMNKLAEKCMELNVTLTKEKQKSFSEVLKKSSAYIMLKRCGYDTKNVFFDSLKSFDSRFTTVIGTSLKNISANAVRQVERVVGIPLSTT